MGDRHRADVTTNGKNDELTASVSNTDSTSTPTPEKPEFSEPEPVELKIGCWNVRRGLVKREHEITDLLRNQNLDVLFLVETDTTMITEEKDYKMKGFKTLFPLRKKDELKTRIICLITEELKNVKLRNDLMNTSLGIIFI